MHALTYQPSVLGARDQSDASVLALILFASAAWALCVYLAQFPGHTHFDTAEIFSWSRMGYVLNVGRHPPLLPWLIHTLDVAYPIGRHGLFLLAFVNMTVGAIATWRLARIVIGPQRAVMALPLYALVPYATFLAMKLNHNAILISLWPLTAWAFMACLTKPAWWRGVLFGVSAAALVHAKYFGLLLLFAAIVVSLWWPQRARFYRSPAPYLAVAVFCALVAPHVYAAYFADADAFASLFNDSGFERRNPLVHALEPGVGGKGGTFRLLRSNAVSVLPMLAGFALLARWQGGLGSPGDCERNRLVAYGLLFAIPYALTVIVVAALRLPASPEWSAPLLAMLPVAFAGWLKPPSTDQSRLLVRACVLGCCLLPLAGPISLYAGFRSGVPAAVLPRVEIARDAAAIWRAATGQPLRILGPEQGLANIASLELPERPYSWPSFEPSVSWITPAMVDRHGVLVACASSDQYCMQFAPPLIARSTMTCELKHRRTLWGLQGPEITTTLHLMPPKGMKLRSASGIPGCREIPLGSR